MAAAPMQSRRRHTMAVAAAVFSITTILFFVCIPAGLIALPLGSMPARRRAQFVLPGWMPLRILARHHQSPPETEAMLLPEWEVLVLLRPNASTAVPGADENATCVFHHGMARGSTTSLARALGPLSSSSGGRRAYTCVVPETARGQSPLAVAFSASTAATAPAGDDVSSSPVRSREMLKWGGRIVYGSVVIDGGDVLVFAKGVNLRRGVNRAATDVRCLYYYHGGGGDTDDVVVVASLQATTSAQQVFRCPPPPLPTPVERASQDLGVTLAIVGEEHIIPSIATYDPPRPGSPAIPEKRLICACTMVYDAAKFLREWAVYHASVGVDRFYVYDNGSKDDLADQVRHLTSVGFGISIEVWPWPKTQEAALSHGAWVHQDSCEWMLFIDIDEFIFSPHWSRSEKPTKSMLQSVVSSVAQDVGQVSFWCADFGPSGRTTHPKEGVIQGYTCRKQAMERRKSLVRLNAVDRSFGNLVHHFILQPRFRGVTNKQVRVNHYKYQVWDEYKVKFHRRASAYTIDWTDRRSSDRIPDLGFEVIEPSGWEQKFCEVNDTLLRDATQRWLGVGFGNKHARWQIGTSPGSP